MQIIDDGPAPRIDEGGADVYRLILETSLGAPIRNANMAQGVRAEEKVLRRLPEFFLREQLSGDRGQVRLLHMRQVRERMW